MKNIRIVAPTAIFVAILVLACGFSSCETQSAPKFKIGVSQCSADEWRDKMNAEMQREMLFHDDSYIEFQNADDNNQTQIQQIQSFIDRNFDLIIVAPNEAEALTPIIKKAYESGIPVIIFDRRIIGDSFTSYIDLDNEGIGESAAEYAHSLLGDSPSEIIEITGLPGSTPAQERHKGFVEGIQKFPSLKLVASINGRWDREMAEHIADSLLAVYPHLKLLYAHSDYMAIGAANVFKKLGRTDIKVLGTDASPGQGIEAVRDHVIDATFIYPTEGHRIIDTAFAILEGRKFDKVEHIPSLSSVDSSNADILLRQYDLLSEETDKVLALDQVNDRLEKKYNSLNRFSHTILVLAIVLGVIFILLLIFFLRNRKLQRELKIQNEKLIEERDKQIKLYQQLDTVLAKEDDFYNRFISIIKTQYANSSLNTESLAQQLNLGGAQLTRKIKSLTNFSPVELLRNYRLEQARHLLLTTAKNINEITYEVGFASAPYFTKCFREHFGLTPTDLRTQKD